MRLAPPRSAWYHNLVANPTASVELPNESFDVLARVAKGDKRDRLFHKVVENFPIYGGYQQKTGRRIPVIVPERVTSRRRSTLRVASPTRTGEPRK